MRRCGRRGGAWCGSGSTKTSTRRSRSCSTRCRTPAGALDLPLVGEPGCDASLKERMRSVLHDTDVYCVAELLVRRGVGDTGFAEHVDIGKTLEVRCFAGRDATLT